MRTRQVVVVGAGITGLAAAYRLQKVARARGLALEIRILEAQDEVGGKIRTHRHGDFLLELGPDSWHAADQRLRSLIADLELGAEVIPGGASGTYVHFRGALRAIPAGAVLGVPTRLWPVLASPIVSARAKLRLGAALFPSTQTVPEDESVASLYRRLFGGEISDRLAAPLLSVIYSDDIEHLSARIAVPRIVRMLEQQRSVILGLRREAGTSRKEPGGAALRAPSATFVDGMQSLPEALAARLSPGTVLRATAACAVTRSAERLCVATTGGEVLAADEVIIATPSPVAARLLNMERDFGELHQRRPASVASVALGFAQRVLPEALRGTGLVVAREAQQTIAACTWVHLKWPHSAPPGKALLRCYLAPPEQEGDAPGDDDVLIAAVRGDLTRILGLHANPDFSLVSRFPQAIPRYDVGHFGRVLRLRSAVSARFAGVQIAGASYGGPGLGTCADDGARAAEKALARLFDIDRGRATVPDSTAARPATEPAAGPVAFT